MIAELWENVGSSCSDGYLGKVEEGGVAGLDALAVGEADSKAMGCGL